VLFSSVKILIFKCLFVLYLSSLSLSPITVIFDRHKPSRRCGDLDERF